MRGKEIPLGNVSRPHQGEGKPSTSLNKRRTAGRGGEGEKSSFDMRKGARQIAANTVGCSWLAASRLKDGQPGGKEGRGERAKSCLNRGASP